MAINLNIYYSIYDNKQIKCNAKLGKLATSRNLQVENFVNATFMDLRYLMTDSQLFSNIIASQDTCSLGLLKLCCLL